MILSSLQLDPLSHERLSIRDGSLIPASRRSSSGGPVSPETNLLQPEIGVDGEGEVLQHDEPAIQRREERPPMFLGLPAPAPSDPSPLVKAVSKMAGFNVLGTQIKLQMGRSIWRRTLKSCILVAKVVTSFFPIFLLFAPFAHRMTGRF
jgi:hypothetical protein